jgi:hypothetical protein
MGEKRDSLARCTAFHRGSLRVSVALDSRSFSHVWAGDPVELAAAIDRYIRKPRRLGELDDTCRELHSRLSWQAVAALQQEIYASIPRV